MSPEEEAQLRQAVRKAQRLPEPDWNLFARATHKRSRAGKMLRTSKTQQATSSTANAVDRFLYDLEADEAAKRRQE